MNICVPAISYLQWHPISIATSPDTPTIRCCIKSLGGWSAELNKMAQTKSTMRILVTGPYGNVSVDLEDRSYQHIIFLCGGIGITPMQSICNNLLYQYAELNRPIRKIYFVWSTREPELVKDLMMESSIVKAVGDQKGFGAEEQIGREPICQVFIHLTKKMPESPEAEELKKQLAEKKITLVNERPDLAAYI